MIRLAPRHRFRRVALPLVAALAVSVVLPSPTATAREVERDSTAYSDINPRPALDGPRIDAPAFREVGRVPILLTPGKPIRNESSAVVGTLSPLRSGDEEWSPNIQDGKSTGWLILSPTSRRGYTVVEQSTTTVIQSFDIDTLQVRRTLRVPGSPVPSNYNGSTGVNNAANSGDIVHAVDPGAKRIYLAMGDAGTYVPASGESYHQDSQRRVTYFLAIDEATFDTDPAKATGTFGFPTGRDSLAIYPLMGMTVNRHRVAPTTPGNLVLIFSSPYFVTTTPGVVRTVPGAYDHTLAQWNPADVTIGTPLPEWSTTAAAKPVTEVWQQVLTQCATTTLTSSEHAETAPRAGTLNYQWGILVGRDSIHLGCQSAPGSGAVVRVDLDPVTGHPRADQVLFPLGRHLADVLVDEPAGRLMLRTFGGGATYWIFDTATGRYTGATMASPVDGSAIAAGIDPSTGRLYLLGADICVPRKGGGVAPLRGGLRVTETRLDPVPAPDVVLPELAYHSHWRIQVDPVARRVFIRRGYPDNRRHFVYPGCDPHKMDDRPGEGFYRVYEDRRPPVTPPGELDDATLTTNTAEGKGRTQASFLGAGSGYGMRSLLVGGLDAPTQDAPSTLGSLCGRDTREVVAGSVGKVEVSDQSTAAESASLDADSRTRGAMGDPFNRCRPQVPQRPMGVALPADELNRCHRNADVREGSFDQAKPGVDENGDGCVDRDDDNRYAARCVGTRQAESPGFDDDEHEAPRDGFEARATCDADDEKAAASSRAAAASDSVEEARRRAGQAGEPVRVAHAASTVEVVRKEGRGITVKVDSVARGVEIPGVGTIGVIRSEATSTSTGRDGGARTAFTRTICDVRIQGLVISSCLGDEHQQQSFVELLNKALGGRAKASLRTPDPTLGGGTPHGYLAGVQRDRKELFADQVVTGDPSLAVPGLEIMFFQGEGAGRTGRQVVHLAGVQASTSYGIACTYGRKADGTCAAAGDPTVDFGGGLDGGAGDGGATFTGGGGEEAAGAPLGPVLAGSGREGILTRLLRAVPRALAEALRLLFNNPRELGLLAALWALLYAPCYLGDRRRAVREIAARRLSGAPSPS